MRASVCLRISARSVPPSLRKQRGCKRKSGRNSSTGLSPATLPRELTSLMTRRDIASGRGQINNSTSSASMRLCQATLREIQMPLVRPFETSFGRTTDRRILLVEVEAAGVTGGGECVAGERPSYSPETIETAWLVLRDFIWPALVRKEFSAAADVWEILSPLRGAKL